MRCANALLLWTPPVARAVLNTLSFDEDCPTPPEYLVIINISASEIVGEVLIDIQRCNTRRCCSSIGTRPTWLRPPADLYLLEDLAWRQT